MNAGYEFDLPAGIVLSEPICPGCEAEIGEYHTDLCDIAPCAETGLQRSAGCYGTRGCHNRRGANCRTRWTGAFPGAAEAHEYGLYCLAFPPYPPCPPGTPDSMEDLNTLLRLCRWDRTARRWRLKGPKGAGSTVESCAEGVAPGPRLGEHARKSVLLKN